METTIQSKKQQLIASLESTNISALTLLKPSLVGAAKENLQFAEFPTTREEDWKYSRTTRLSAENWKVQRSSSAIDISSYSIPSLNADLAVFVNGFFRKDLSSIHLDSDLSLHSIDEIPEEFKSSVAGVIGSETESFKDLFHNLNAAYTTGGLFFIVRKDTVSRPLHLLFLQEGEYTFAQPRIAGIVRSGAELHLVTSYHSIDGKKGFTNSVTEIAIESNAALVWDKIQAESDDNFSIHNEHIRQASDSRFTISTLTVDGGWIRNNLNIRLDGVHCETHLNGFYLPRRNQHIDNHTLVDHLLPHSESNELYKGVLYDRGRAVFNGKVFVRTDAQKTNAFQKNANIMISDDATVNTKPELEIYADDVKCSHGSTTGQFDESSVFYLRARGISEDAARRMLTTAFINDVLNKVENGSVREYVTGALEQRGLLLQ